MSQRTEIKQENPQERTNRLIKKPYRLHLHPQTLSLCPKTETQIDISDPQNPGFHKRNHQSPKASRKAQNIRQKRNATDHPFLSNSRFKSKQNQEIPPLAVAVTVTVKKTKTTITTGSKTPITTGS